VESSSCRSPSRSIPDPAGPRMRPRNAAADLSPTTRFACGSRAFNTSEAARTVQSRRPPPLGALRYSVGRPGRAATRSAHRRRGADLGTMGVDLGDELRQVALSSEGLEIDEIDRRRAPVERSAQTVDRVMVDPPRREAVDGRRSTARW